VVARGEIWWHEPPDQKPRPHLIMTRDEAIPVLNWVVAVPSTSTVRNIPSQVLLDRSDGMPDECALTFDNIRVVRKAYLTRRITTLPAHRWQEVCEALNVALAC